MFHAQVFDDVMTFEYLKSQNMTISRTKRAFEVKSYFFLFKKCSLLSIQNKLAKMQRTQTFNSVREQEIQMKTFQIKAKQRNIQNPVKHLTWIFLKKQLTALTLHFFILFHFRQLIYASICLDVLFQEKIRLIRVV